MVLNLAAWRREEAGDYAGAHRLLQQALALSPGDVMVLGAIGAVLRKEHRLDEALAVLDRVVAAEPRHSAAWLERGYTLEALRSEAAAAESYSRALALDPNLAPALGKLADIAAKKGDREAAAEAMPSAPSPLDPANPAATFALATMEIEARDGGAGGGAPRSAARPRRSRPTTGPAPSPCSATRSTGRTDAPRRSTPGTEAQANFRRRLFGRCSRPGPGRPSHRAFIESDRRRRSSARRPWRSRLRHRPSPAPPRATSSCSAIRGRARRWSRTSWRARPRSWRWRSATRSPTPTRSWSRNDGTMPDLDALDPALLADLRARYWARVRGMAGDVAGRVFVDMNPFNGIKLPIIARLFPEARILIMRRDPRDVVLSCYRINFTPSPAAFAFSDLEETARHYDALMRLIELCRERLPLAFHEVWYHRLVADFEPTVRAMAEFVGLEWTDDFHAFDRTAQSRGVRTASATQVRRGLYDGGGRWRRYAEQLAPALPILAPWVERFGSSPEPCHARPSHFRERHKKGAARRPPR